ncbi:hypothetical protein N0V94_004611 [Neodidymelliopsis sp. IMI 364377]|nr:hypothetical protein N0V94_004611 [Neodidymelliopsis sp. IMI 364377]
MLDICITVNAPYLRTALAALTSATRYATEITLPSASPSWTITDHTSPANTIYLLAPSSLPARAHLAIRSALLTSPDLRAEFTKLKHLAMTHASLKLYNQSKLQLLQRILVSSRQFSKTELLILLRSDGTARWQPIRTPRLELREFELDDVDAFFELESDEEVVRFQTYGPKSRERARRDVEEGIMKSYVEGGETVELGVVFERKWVGRVGARIALKNGGDKKSVEEEGKVREEMPEDGKKLKHIDLWYSFLPSFQGQGFATEALRAFIDALVEREGKGQDDLEMELEIECDPRNLRSWKMAERLEFSKHSFAEKVYECKGEWVDSVVYIKQVV